MSFMKQGGFVEIALTGQNNANTSEAVHVDLLLDSITQSTIPYATLTGNVVNLPKGTYMLMASLTYTKSTNTTVIESATEINGLEARRFGATAAGRAADQGTHIHIDIVTLTEEGNVGIRLFRADGAGTATMSGTNSHFTIIKIG